MDQTTDKDNGLYLWICDAQIFNKLIFLQNTPWKTRFSVLLYNVVGDSGQTSMLNGQQNEIIVYTVYFLLLNQNASRKQTSKESNFK